MSYKQKAIIWTGLAVLAVLVAIPPWKYASVHGTPAGYGLIFWPSAGSKWFAVTPTGNHVVMDLPRLLLPMLIVAMFTLAAAFLTGAKVPAAAVQESPSSHAVTRQRAFATERLP